MDADKSCSCDILDLGNETKDEKHKLVESTVFKSSLEQIDSILKDLRIPELVAASNSPEDAIIAFQIKSVTALKSLHRELVRDGICLLKEESMSCNLLMCCAAFSAGSISELEIIARWSSEELQKESNAILEFLKCLLSEMKSVHEAELSTQSLVAEILPKCLPSLKQQIRTNLGQQGGSEQAIEKELKDNRGPALGLVVVASCQLAWCVVQLTNTECTQLYHLLVPCVLAALDHYSPRVQRSGMVALEHLYRHTSKEAVEWFGEVALDALCHILIGCDDELWEICLRVTVGLAVNVGETRPRFPWYNQIVETTILDMERRGHEQQRRIIWLKEIPPLMHCMGIFLVAHFRRLLPLLFSWLHSGDENTKLLVVGLFETLIPTTWPRLVSHKMRLLHELSNDSRNEHVKADEKCLQLIKALQRSQKDVEQN